MTERAQRARARKLRELAHPFPFSLKQQASISVYTEIQSYIKPYLQRLAILLLTAIIAGNQRFPDAL